MHRIFSDIKNYKYYITTDYIKGALRDKVFVDFGALLLVYASACDELVERGLLVFSP
jgi:hypothetical protein